MTRKSLAASALAVFCLTSMAAGYATPAQHAPLAGPAYVLSYGATLVDASTPRTAVSAPVLRLTTQATLTCQTVVTIARLQIGRDCVPTPALAAAIAR